MQTNGGLIWMLVVSGGSASHLRNRRQSIQGHRVGNLLDLGLAVRWCRASFLYLVSLDYVIIIAIIVAPEELPSSSGVINTFIILGLNISASDTS